MAAESDEQVHIFVSGKVCPRTFRLHAPDQHTVPITAFEDPRRPSTLCAADSTWLLQVQGVYYRDTTVLKAKQLQLRGWVRNLQDSRVEIVAAGPRAVLEELLQWCPKGPEGAHEVGLNDAAGLTMKRRVDDVAVEWIPAESHEDFTQFSKKPTGTV